MLATSPPSLFSPELRLPSLLRLRQHSLRRRFAGVLVYMKTAGAFRSSEIRGAMQCLQYHATGGVASPSATASKVQGQPWRAGRPKACNAKAFIRNKNVPVVSNDKAGAMVQTSSVCRGWGQNFIKMEAEPQPSSSAPERDTGLRSIKSGINWSTSPKGGNHHGIDENLKLSGNVL